MPVQECNQRHVTRTNSKGVSGIPLPETAPGPHANYRTQPPPQREPLSGREDVGHIGRPDAMPVQECNRKHVTGTNSKGVSGIPLPETAPGPHANYRTQPPPQREPLVRA